MQTNKGTDNGRLGWLPPTIQLDFGMLRMSVSEAKYLTCDLRMADFRTRGTRPREVENVGKQEIPHHHLESTYFSKKSNNRHLICLPKTEHQQIPLLSVQYTQLIVKQRRGSRWFHFISSFKWKWIKWQKKSEWYPPLFRKKALLLARLELLFLKVKFKEYQIEFNFLTEGRKELLSELFDYIEYK